MGISHVWFALTLMVIGVLFGLEAVGVIDAGDAMSDWWPAFIMAAGLLQLLFGRPRHWFGPTLLIAASAIVLARTTGVLSSIGPLLWAVIFFSLGLALAMRAATYRRTSADADWVNSFVMFGGREMASHSKHFRGGSVSSVFGGTELDLRDAELASDASLEVFSAFGATEVAVPYGWRVEMQGTPIFGGFENATAKDVDLAPDAPVLALDGVALFGAIEVKH